MIELSLALLSGYVTKTRCVFSKLPFARKMCVFSKLPFARKMTNLLYV